MSLTSGCNLQENQSSDNRKIQSREKISKHLILFINIDDLSLDIEQYVYKDQKTI